MSAFQMIQSDAFSPHDLCEVQIHAQHQCLHFNNNSYLDDAAAKSSLCDQLWSFVSLPVCERHPITAKIKDILGGRKFDLPHIKTAISQKWRELPGIRMSEFAKDHKRVNVSFELSFWATVGQLKFLSEDAVDKLSIEVHTAVGKMQL